MQSATLHIKVRPEIANELKSLSQKREISVGELVRQALLSCYQLDLRSLGKKQRRALDAFQGGYISLGKLTEEMGMNVWETRQWLHEHGISPNHSFYKDDVENA